jgi:hypothetical protein
MHTTIKAKLILAATQYDVRKSKGKRYNVYALGHYYGRIDDVMADIEAGAKPREALIRGFSGSLLDALLKSIGEPKHTLAEKNARIFYEPVNSK